MRLKIWQGEKDKNIRKTYKRKEAEGKNLEK